MVYWWCCSDIHLDLPSTEADWSQVHFKVASSSELDNHSNDNTTAATQMPLSGLALSD